MVAPRCLMHGEGGTFEELPAYDLAMQSDAVVVLVAQMSLFGWALNLLLKKEKVRQLVEHCLKSSLKYGFQLLGSILSNRGALKLDIFFLG